MRSLLLLLALGPAVALGQPAPPPSEPAPAPAPEVAPAPELPAPPPPAGQVTPPGDAAAAAAAAVPDDLPPPPPPTAGSPDAPWPRFGLKLDLGVPQAAVVAFVYRPIPWLRLTAGPAWNYIGWGVQVGASWTPIRWAISPTLNVEYGKFFDADASRFFKPSNPDDTDLRPLLKKVGYDYFSGQLGLELGSQRGFSFYLRGGLAYFRTALHGANQVVSGGSSTSDTRVAITDPKLRAVVPTAGLGFLIFF